MTDLLANADLNHRKVRVVMICCTLLVTSHAVDPNHLIHLPNVAMGLIQWDWSVVAIKLTIHLKVYVAQVWLVMAARIDLQQFNPPGSINMPLQQLCSLGS
jgi:hypothetical protein